MSGGPLWLTAINPSMSCVWSREFQLQRREHIVMLEMYGDRRFGGMLWTKFILSETSKLFCVKLNMECYS